MKIKSDVMRLCYYAGMTKKDILSTITAYRQRADLLKIENKSMILNNKYSAGKFKDNLAEIEHLNEMTGVLVDLLETECYKPW